MLNPLKALLASCVFVSFVASAAAQQTLATPAERLVNIAPCRLVDTRVNVPADKSEEAARKIDVASTRCGRFVPSAATAYSLRITSYDRANDGKAPTQGEGERAPLSRHPAGPPITFPVPSRSHITVDLEGYYVSPNTPVDPTLESLTANGTAANAGMASAPQSLSAGTPLRPHAQSLHGVDGTAGEMYLDASRVGSVGVFGIASAAHPWVGLMSGLSDGTDGLGVYNGNYSELMRVSSNGPTRMILNWSYLSGRTDYRETTSIANNTIHDVRIVDPRDSAGGATNRVTFFEAKTDSEVNSPATTKFRAYTYGSTTQSHINFDSQIVDHNSNQYYYRAFSVYDPNGTGKETFWLKAATAGGPFDQTRADMYVSGRVGIGTTAPVYALDVSGRGRFTGWDTPATSGAGAEIGYDGTNGYLRLFDRSASAYKPLLLDGNNILMQTGSGGNVGIGAGIATPDARLHVAGTGHFTGNVTVDGIIYAKYQDVAEWVPSEGGLPAGTVVVLNRAKTNAVTASSNAYDTAVAGVVSGEPGVLLGVAGENKAKIASTGRVKVRVDATKQPIRIGDLLVTSDHPGMAMKSEPLDLGGVRLHRPGTLIGKALEPLAGGQGEILVLLSLQ